MYSLPVLSCSDFLLPIPLFNSSLPKNGFWFALGWCALFFLPLAIFLIVLSKHFRQHRDVDEIMRTTEYPEYQ